MHLSPICDMWFTKCGYKRFTQVTTQFCLCVCHTTYFIQTFISKSMAFFSDWRRDSKDAGRKPEVSSGITMALTSTHSSVLLPPVSCRHPRAVWALPKSYHNPSYWQIKFLFVSFIAICMNYPWKCLWRCRLRFVHLSLLLMLLQPR